MVYLNKKKESLVFKVIMNTTHVSPSSKDPRYKTLCGACDVRMISNTYGELSNHEDITKLDT